MVMLFMNAKVRNFLLLHGFVYTFRRKRHKLGKDWATDKRGGHKICDIYVAEEWHISHVEDLRLFVDGSGFASIEEWIDAIKQFNPKMNRLEGYIYHVRKC